MVSARRSFFASSIICLLALTLQGCGKAKEVIKGKKWSDSKALAKEAMAKAKELEADDKRFAGQIERLHKLVSTGDLLEKSEMVSMLAMKDAEEKLEHLTEAFAKEKITSEKKEDELEDIPEIKAARAKVDDLRKKYKKISESDAKLYEQVFDIAERLKKEAIIVGGSSEKEEEEMKHAVTKDAGAAKKIKLPIVSRQTSGGEPTEDAAEQQRAKELAKEKAAKQKEVEQEAEVRKEYEEKLEEAKKKATEELEREKAKLLHQQQETEQLQSQHEEKVEPQSQPKEAGTSQSPRKEKAELEDRNAEASHGKDKGADDEADPQPEHSSQDKLAKVSSSSDKGPATRRRSSMKLPDIIENATLPAETPPNQTIAPDGPAIAPVDATPLQPAVEPVAKTLQPLAEPVANSVLTAVNSTLPPVAEPVANAVVPVASSPAQPAAAAVVEVTTTVANVAAPATPDTVSPAPGTVSPTAPATLAAPALLPSVAPAVAASAAPALLEPAGAPVGSVTVPTATVAPSAPLAAALPPAPAAQLVAPAEQPVAEVAAPTAADAAPVPAIVGPAVAPVATMSISPSQAPPRQEKDTKKDKKRIADKKFLVSSVERAANSPPLQVSQRVFLYALVSVAVVGVFGFFITARRVGNSRTDPDRRALFMQVPTEETMADHSDDVNGME